MPRSAASTQNRTILRLKARVSHSPRGTRWDPLKTAPPKSTARKSTESTPGVAWTQALLGQGGGVEYSIACQWAAEVPFVATDRPVPVHTRCLG